MSCACQTMQGLDGGECDALVNFGVWPSSVQAFKVRINGFVESTDLGVRGCPGLSAPERSAWQQFVTDWRSFNAKSVGWFGAYNEWQQTCAYSHALDGWQEKLAKSCTLPLPDNVKGAEGASSVVKWIAAAVIASAVIGGVYIVRRRS